MEKWTGSAVEFEVESSNCRLKGMISWVYICMTLFGWIWWPGKELLQLIKGYCWWYSESYICILIWITFFVGSKGEDRRWYCCSWNSQGWPGRFIQVFLNRRWYYRLLLEHKVCSRFFSMGDGCYFGLNLLYVVLYLWTNFSHLPAQLLRWSFNIFFSYYYHIIYLLLLLFIIIINIIY